MYVTVKQVDVKGDTYTYRFSRGSDHGLLELDASTKNITVLQAMDTADGTANFFRARAAILRELAEGVIPYETFFASA